MSDPESEPTQDLPEEEEADESPLALNLHYPNISAPGANPTFLIWASSSLTITERNAVGISVRNAKDYRVMSLVLPGICPLKAILENGNSSKTTSMHARKRWQCVGNRKAVP
jgi:hypothetical protein